VSDSPTVAIDLSRVRQNAVDIAHHAGVPVIAVVKADAYGLGAVEVARAISDAVSGFYVFDLHEAIEAKLKETGKPTIALLGESKNPDDYLAHNARPVVWDVDRAAALKRARPVLAIDTGQQRFACPPEQIDAVLKVGAIDEAFTHATRLEQVADFAAWMDGRSLRRHAAGSSLLNEPSARFDAVRPGLALYGNAVRVIAPLIDARDSRGPAGYSGFTVPRFGLIRAGYSSAPAFSKSACSRASSNCRLGQRLGMKSCCWAMKSPRRKWAWRGVAQRSRLC
jgi:hypothetical protein